MQFLEARFAVLRHPFAGRMTTEDPSMTSTSITNISHLIYNYLNNNATNADFISTIWINITTKKLRNIHPIYTTLECLNNHIKHYISQISYTFNFHFIQFTIILNKKWYKIYTNIKLYLYLHYNNNSQISITIFH